MKIDGFEQKDSQGFENSYNSYEQYPLEKFFIFTIYQNYTLALTQPQILTNQVNRFFFYMKHYTFILIINCFLYQVNHVQGEPDIYVSRGPDKYPKLNSLVWSSYNWGSESLTISSWDPEYVVGTYYIGVMAYCGADVGTGDSGKHQGILEWGGGGGMWIMW